MPWKCLCGEMVEDRYTAHTHASPKQEWDDKEMKWWRPLGYPPEIWTYWRERPVAPRGS